MVQIPDAPWIREAEINGYTVSDRYDWEDEEEEDDDG